MRKPPLAALAVAGVLTLGASEPSPGPLAPGLTFLPVCSLRLSPGTFGIDVPGLEALRPHLPPRIWRRIVSK